MKSKILLCLATAVLFSIVGIVTLNNFNARVSGQSQPPSYDENYSFSQLNVKARVVNEGGNSSSVSALIEESLATFGAVVGSDVKTRIANSETLYRNNQRNGVAEVEVVEAINGLAVKFNTPDYSKTDLYEVRKLRQSLQILAPQFVGHGRTSEGNFVNAVNPTIVPAMSPTEAVFVTLAMIHQKKANPNYQVSIAERNAMWEEIHTLKVGQSLSANPERTKQMVNAVDDKLQTMSAMEILAIPHRALDILGIEQ